MCRPPSLRLSRQLWLLFLAGLAAAGWLLGYSWGNPAPPTPARGTPPSLPAQPIGERMLAWPTSAPPAQELAREAAAANQLASVGDERTFRQRIDELVDLSQSTAALITELAGAAAAQADQQARQQLAALLIHHPDAGEQALMELTALAPTVAEALDHGRQAVLRLVLRLVLTHDCARRYAAPEDTTTRHSLDDLATAVLAVMRLGGTAATVGGEVLVDQPYLRLRHEPAVLDLAILANDQFPPAVAVDLLTTLWCNLERDGERTAEQLAEQAIGLLTHPVATLRAAACHRLALDARYRSMALAWLRRQGDAELAGEVASRAVHKLPPDQALLVLTELVPVLPHMPGACLVLAARASETVIAGYCELLAADAEPALRRDLIAGLIAAPAAAARPTIELALQSDPALAVRCQAMLAWTVIDPAEGERACHQILDDPAAAADAGAKATVALALGNLEAAGLTNTIERLGQRLRALELEPSRQKQ